MMLRRLHNRLCQAPRYSVPLLVAVLCGLCSLGWSAPPRTLVQQGNEQYQTGHYDEALELYRQAAEAGLANSPELLHNQAAALYHLGQRDEARALWQKLAEQGNAQLEAPMRYNLGNCEYADALDAVQGQDFKAALEHLQAAQQLYHEALQLDPAIQDARANLELAEHFKTQLEQLQQQQQQQGGQSDQQDQQDQQNLPDEQSQQQSNSQPDQSQQQQSGDADQQQDQQSAQDQQQDEQAEQQEGQQQQDEQQSDEQDQQQSDEQQSEEQLAAETQPAAESQPAGEQSQAVPIDMTREQAERLLQMVRDAEKARREELARRRAARQDPVTRDW